MPRIVYLTQMKHYYCDYNWRCWLCC